VEGSRQVSSIVSCCFPVSNVPIDHPSFVLGSVVQGDAVTLQLELSSMTGCLYMV